MEQYEKFTAINGKGIFHHKINLSQLNKGDLNLLPTEIIYLLEQVGVSSYIGGKFWTLDPSEYVDWLNDWLPFDDCSVPFARSAFGDVLFIREQEIMVLNASQGIMSVMTDVDDIDSFINRYLTDAWFYNTFFNGDIFDQLENKTLEANECFAFEPIPALGGKRELESVKKVNMKVHLHLLSGASNLRFYEH